MTRAHCLRGIFAVLCALVSAKQGLGQEKVIWEIGKFDQSSFEFASRIDLSNPQFNPVFTVGRSTPGKDWPAVQPGSLNKSFGGRAHPYAIIFDLPSRPKGIYRLTIAALLARSRVPNLRVEINGQAGLYYFHRQLSYSAGDFGAYSPIYGAGQLDIDLPRSALKAGKNRLTLTAVDDPADGPGDSLLAYDAVRLTEILSAKGRLEPQIGAEPTVFYVAKEKQLFELTDVFVTLGEKVRRGELELSTGGAQFRAQLSPDPDFGQQRFEFALPEFAKAAPASVLLTVNGKRWGWAITLQPQRRWTIDVVPHAHLDIGYTDYQAKVAEVHDRNIDRLIDEIERNPEMRFSLDGSWIVRHYLETRNALAREAFLRLAREGKITIPAQYANLLTGYASLETLIRSTDYSDRLHREAGVPFDYVNITDVPSYSWSYASVLHALGLNYFAAASNNDRAPILLYGRWNEKSPFWWEGPDGSKVLMAYTRQYLQLAFTCGLPPEVATCRQSLPTFLQAFESPEYRPDTVLMYGTQVENTDLVPGDPAFVRTWNSQFAFPKFVPATFPDYFREIERNYGAVLPTVRGDGGPYWEDGDGSDARYTALDRRNQQRAASAEKLSTISASLSPTLTAPRKLIDRMWTDLILFAEHTWTSWGSISRPQSEESVRQLAVKDARAIDGQQAVNALMDQSLSQLADRIRMPARALVVFNPLSWPRSGLVETDSDDGMEIREYPEMKPVGVEVLRQGSGYQHVRFLAEDVPSLGYKCYRIERAAGSTPSATPQSSVAAANRIENAFYRIEVDPSTGAVRSLYDKELERELVDDSSPYQLNRFLYVSGGDGATQIVYLRKALPLAQLTVSLAAGGRVLGARKTPYGQILTVEASAPHTPLIRTDIILFDREKKIEFTNFFRKDPVRDKEAIYFAFPFAVKKPAFSYEIQNGWVDPSRDMLQGAGLEWFTVQHWVRVENDKLAVGLVPLDAPLVTLGDINRGTWPEHFEPKSAAVFSYALNNYWHTNYRRVQEGEFSFRYVLTSGKTLSPGFLARLGRAAMTPLEVGELISNDKFDNPARPLDPAPTSFLQIDSPNVILENWKAANDGRGSVLRMVEVGGRSVTATLTFPQSVLQRAWLSNAREEDQEELKVAGHSVSVLVQPHEIITLRVLAQPAFRSIVR